MEKHADQQASHELAIFNTFLACEGAPHSTGSVEGRRPPEPDIRYQIDGQSVAFELVELVDEKWAQHFNDLVRIQNYLGEMYQRAESPTKDTMAQRLSNGLIYVRFIRDTGRRQREKSIDQLFELLAELPANFTGDHKLSKDSSLGAIIGSVKVSRGDWAGPLFQVEGGLSISDPTLSAVQGKWTKKYSTDVPIELLAYYDVHPTTPESFWKGKLKEFLAANWPDSPFRKVWVCDPAAKAIIFSAEKPGVTDLS